RGNGDGTFQLPQNFPVGSAPLAVAVGSLNSDAIQDLVAANFSANTVSVLLGNGDGTFQAAQTFTVGTNPESVAVGDFNRDGVPDLAVANFGSNTVTVLLALRVATPAFSPPGGTYDRPQSVAISDATPGATIYYTTDASLVVTALGPATVKAMAVAPGWSQSAVASATYTSGL